MTQPLPNLVVIFTFILMGVGYILMVYFVMTREKDLWGKPSIQPFLFYTGKYSMYFCWGLTLLNAIIPGFGWMEAPLWMRWTGAVLLFISTILLLLSFYFLGSALRYGLPENETRLRTTGVYRITRHPMYMGVLLVTVSSIIFFPGILNIIIGIYCIFTHYLMILSEERFLAGRFGSEWEAYTKKVRRFL